MHAEREGGREVRADNFDMKVVKAHQRLRSRASELVDAPRWIEILRGFDSRRLYAWLSGKIYSRNSSIQESTRNDQVHTRDRA
jgi:hypothetical protein